MMADRHREWCRREQTLVAQRPPWPRGDQLLYLIVLFRRVLSRHPFRINQSVQNLMNRQFH